MKLKIKMTANTSYYFAIVIWYIVGIISESMLTEFRFISILTALMRYCVLALLIIKLFLQKYSHRDAILLGSVGFIFTLSYFLSGYLEMIWILLFVAAAKEIDFRKVIKQTMIITLIGTVSIMLLAQGGVIENVAIFGRSRIQLLGFRHHNFPGCRILICYICYIYLRFDRYNLKDIFVCIGALAFLYKVIDSRTSALLVAVATILVLVVKLLDYFERRKNRPLVNIGLYAMMLFAPIFSFIATLRYNPNSKLFSALDEVVYKRFSYGFSIHREYGFSLFGQQVDLISTLEARQFGLEASVLDNAYMHLFIRCGAMVGLLILLGWFLVAKISIERKTYSLAIIVAVYFMCGISEKWLFSITYNPFVILLSMGIYCKNTILLDIPVLDKKKRRIRMPLR